MVIDYYYGSVCKLFDAISGYLTDFSVIFPVFVAGNYG
jgi:hypothetical protein